MSALTDPEPRAQLQSGEVATIRAKDVKLWWWIRMALHTFLVLTGQTIATLLGRLYYDKGASSNWMATLVQLIGFPFLIPFLFTSSYKHAGEMSMPSKHQSSLVIALVYLVLGLLLAGDCLLYSIGLKYMPGSTYSLICASQLAFNALFSYLLNRQKFTPYIINSLVLLTISSTLLVFQPDSDSPTGVSKANYVIGFICTVAASAGYALVLSLTQLAFKKVLKKESVAAVIDMLIYPSAIAAVATIVGLFASGEWNNVKLEMNSFKLGQASYVLPLVGIAVCWQIFSIGTVGLIYEISALFSNVISTLGLPIVPVFAVIFFHDKMDGIKIIAMLLAIWGFISYGYQQYIDESKPKTPIIPRPQP